MVGCRASALCYRGNRLAAIDLSAVAREIRGSDAVLWSDSGPRASAGVRGPPTPPPFSPPAIHRAGAVAGAGALGRVWRGRSPRQASASVTGAARRLRPRATWWDSSRAGPVVSGVHELRVNRGEGGSLEFRPGTRRYAGAPGRSAGEPASARGRDRPPGEADPFSPPCPSTAATTAEALVPGFGRQRPSTPTVVGGWNSCPPFERRNCPSARGLSHRPPPAVAGSVVNRCGGGWSAVADAPSAPIAVDLLTICRRRSPATPEEITQ